MGDKMTREEQKVYNAEFYPASVLTWMNEATDRAYNIFEKIRVCENCKHYKAENKQCVNEVSIAFTSQEAIYTDDGCNKWEKK
jgi:hypothetical protein